MTFRRCLGFSFATLVAACSSTAPSIPDVGDAGDAGALDAQTDASTPKPDRLVLSYPDTDGRAKLFVLDLTAANPVAARVGSPGAGESDAFPSFSVDGKSIVYVRGKGTNEPGEIRRIDVDGTNDRKVATCHCAFPQFAADGSILYVDVAAGPPVHYAVMRVVEGATPAIVPDGIGLSEKCFRAITVAPDGKRVYVDVSSVDLECTTSMTGIYTTAIGAISLGAPNRLSAPYTSPEFVHAANGRLVMPAMEAVAGGITPVLVSTRTDLTDAKRLLSPDAFAGFGTFALSPDGTRMVAVMKDSRGYALRAYSIGANGAIETPDAVFPTIPANARVDLAWSR